MKQLILVLFETTLSLPPVFYFRHGHFFHVSDHTIRKDLKEKKMYSSKFNSNCHQKHMKTSRRRKLFAVDRKSDLYESSNIKILGASLVNVLIEVVFSCHCPGDTMSLHPLLSLGNVSSQS
ncbi:hypothetical protein CEXT_718821 [Caerostris extrusa]|uniref:Uncharacterized protein n=1 Tax=Caerostris extrusa TaxID=172846 RepID=A0AAV4PTJ6_CAEEX|nr:hypothetical protein CEXT_718821 [Caerostris extrusa]